MRSWWQVPHCLIASSWNFGRSCLWISCALWQSLQPGAASMPCWRSLPCLPPVNRASTSAWQVPQVSGTRARLMRLAGSPLARMSCAPWQSVHSGANLLCGPLPPTSLPCTLSWYFLPTLPPGSLAFATYASLPWHAAQVASRLAWLVRDAGSLDRRMSCVPWQSVHDAASDLPSARALP